jgi:hypothetical protein
MVLLLAAGARPSWAASPSTTLVTGTLYYSDGTPATGTLTITWPSFTTSSGYNVGASSNTIALASDGSLSVSLVCNTGSTPASSYHVVLHLDKGTPSQEDWTVPCVTQTTRTAVLSTVQPAAIAQQYVGRDYVDTAIASVKGGQTLLTASNNYSSGTTQNFDTAIDNTCAEHYLTTAMAGDYGKALNAAVAAQSLMVPSLLRVCVPGNHPVSTPIVFDRPVNFVMQNSKLIPQPALSSTPVTLTGATLTAGSQIVTVSSTSGLTTGMAIGGVGTGSANYISGIGSGTITLAIVAKLTPIGNVTSGSSTVTNISDMRGLAVGQTLTWQGQTTGIAITAVNYANQSVTLASAAPATVNLVALTVSGSWSVNLTAVQVKPVIAWVHNNSALMNSEGQNIGGSMEGVYIADTANMMLDASANVVTPGTGVNGALGRSLTGVQGVLIQGWDRFVSRSLTVDNLDGAGLILGGVNRRTDGIGSPVRESQFYNTQIRDSGDPLTHQASIEILTTTGSVGDEINQIGFFGGEAVFNYAEGIAIGTYKATDSAGVFNMCGPRMVWFYNNFQIENGNHTPHQQITNPFDNVYIQMAQDVYFSGAEFGATGYGRANIHNDGAVQVTVDNSYIAYDGKRVAYTVGVANGSSAVTYVGGGNGKFDDSGLWDAQGVTITDGASCTTATLCAAYLPVSGAVASGGQSLTLTAPWSGATNASTATLTIGYGGYFHALTSSDTLGARLSTRGNYWSSVATGTLTLLGIPTPATATAVGYYLGEFTNDNGVFNFGKNILVSGALTVTAGATAGGSTIASTTGTPLTAKSTLSSTAVTPLAALATGLSSNSGVASLPVGYNTANYNSAVLGFTFNGSGSTNNAGTLALNGGSTALRWKYNGGLYSLNNTLDDGSGNMTVSGTTASAGNVIAPAVLAPASTVLYLGANAANKVEITTAGNMAPVADNTISLGASTLRWANVYATNLSAANNSGYGGGFVATNLTANRTYTLPDQSGTVGLVLTATSGSIGGSALAAGACSAGSVTVAGASTAMTVEVSPAGTNPGDGFWWKGYVSGTNTVKVQVCAVVAGTPTATSYNVRVLQ